MFKVSIIILIAFASAYSKAASKTHSDVGLDVFELATKYGYPIENHEVITEDGYILGMQRIPHGQYNHYEINKPPVLLMHGLVSCSADWINIGPGKSLAYMLADLGYDVWLGNARGNAHSRNHTRYDPDVHKSDFWSYSWNEIGIYDLPAKIDYILQHTNHTQLQYVGYSQGTTAFFVMASSRPEYNEKIKLATSLAPAAEMTFVKNPIFKIIAPFEHILYKAAKIIGIYEILPRSEWIYAIAVCLCDNGKVTQELCKLLLFAIGGYDREQLDGDFIPVLATNTPAGANVKQFIHYAQMVNSKEFRNFDYHDLQVNMENYGSEVPPKYDLTKITAPVALYYGENDWLASVSDAHNIAQQMPNVVRSQLVNYKSFTHLDFIISIDIVNLLNNDVIELMEQYR